MDIAGITSTVGAGIAGIAATAGTIGRVVVDAVPTGVLRDPAAIGIPRPTAHPGWLGNGMPTNVTGRAGFARMHARSIDVLHPRVAHGLPVVVGGAAAAALAVATLRR